MRVADQCEVVVIGAGPAGSTAAQLLASWGWSAVLIDRGATGRALAESLPSSTRKLFAFLGQLARVDGAGFHPNNGNVARWADASRMTRTPDAGFHVSRPAFDRVLREAATAAGARFVDAVVRRVDVGDPTRVTYATPHGDVASIHARYVLDCSGRTGIVARQGWRRADARYHTLAIACEWECPDWPEDERTQTLVESFDSGWAWSVPLSPTRRQCTVMVERVKFRSPERLALHHTFAHDRPLPRPMEREPVTRAFRDRYLQELAKTTELRARLAGASPIAAPWACDASIYDCTQAADQGVLLVGDAASFIEPLSSAGVKKALLSAWRAAVVTNTCLKQASLAGAARELYTRRERHVYADCMRRSTAFFAEAAAAYGSAFWSARADHAHASDASPADAGGEWTDDALARDAAVRRAFEYLRAAERVRLQPAASLRVEPVAAIEGREVVMRDALVVPGLDSPLRFAAGVDLPALARLARAGTDVPALIAAYHAQVGPVPVTGLLTGLSLLVAHHALVAEGSPS
jgi:flavin-dependent dehydrogenase